MDQVSFSGSDFASVASPHLRMMGPGEGVSVWVVGILVTIKVLGNETGGTYSCWEDRVPPGTTVPAHIHSLEEETWYMLDGELEWIVGDQKFHATKGSFVHLPRLVPHQFMNKSGKMATMVLTYAPSGFEKFFLDVGIPVADPSAPGPPPTLTPADMQRILTLGMEYGVKFVLNDGKPEPKHSEL